MQKSQSVELASGENLKLKSTNKQKKTLFHTFIKRRNRSKPQLHFTKESQTFTSFEYDQRYDPESASENTIEISEAFSRIGIESNEVMFKRTNSEFTIKSQPENIIRSIIKKTRFKTNSDSEYQKSINISNASDSLTNVTVSSYNPKDDCKIVHKINGLYNILKILNESENHIVHLLKKYITDKKFQHQLLKSSYEHFSTQYDCKYQATTLTNTMWLQQLEMTKNQEDQLFRRLQLTVTQNRNLQIKVESLKRKCERYATRKNLFPKYFLHLKSLGKRHTLNLINNNKLLQKKIKNLFELIRNFEVELRQLQKENDAFDEENEMAKSKLIQIEENCERTLADVKLEKATMEVDLSRKEKLLEEIEEEFKKLLKELQKLQQRYKDNPYWIKLQYKDGNLPQLINQLHSWIINIIIGLITSSKKSIETTDINYLRETNSRLQENLQKATSVLDQVTSNVDQSKRELDEKYTKIKTNLEHEIINLKRQLDITVASNENLREQLENKEQMLRDSSSSFNSYIQDKGTVFPNDIYDLVTSISQTGPVALPYQKQPQNSAFTMLLFENSELRVKCQKLSEENEEFVKKEKEIKDLHEELKHEHDALKNQYEHVQQTITNMQVDRSKYLEEKNVLKMVFQNLKTEVARMQQLEENVNSLYKENNRLNTIADLNKQIADQLKNDMDLKNNQIMELTQSLEYLNHIQTDSNNEKMSLCEKLTSTEAKRQSLNHHLEVEMRKNQELDEIKKQLESNAKSQIKIYEEMQKSERAALQELLDNFHTVVNHRDSLLKIEERCRKKNKELELRYEELKKIYINAANRLAEKEEEIKAIHYQINEQNQTIKKHNESSTTTNGKYEKMIKKREKLISQMRKEKISLESSNEYLQTNLQKLQTEINEIREAKLQISNSLALKEDENEKLRKDIDDSKTKLKEVHEEKEKIYFELGCLNKIQEKQTTDVHNLLVQFSSKEEEEGKSAIVIKDQEIVQLNKTIVELEFKINFLNEECMQLRKLNEDQNKVLIGYENQLILFNDLENNKRKMEKDLYNVQLELQNAQIELKSTKKDNETLEEQLKKLKVENQNFQILHKNKTKELINEYKERKETIEDEIYTISVQLQEVTANLHTERTRFDDLWKKHDAVRKENAKTTEELVLTSAINETLNKKIADLETNCTNLESEREELQREIHSLLVNLNEERDSNILLSNVKIKLEMAMDQARVQMGLIQQKYYGLETELQECKNTMETSKRFHEYSSNEIEEIMVKFQEKNKEVETANYTVQALKENLDESRNEVIKLKDDTFKYQQQITELEFKNCELTIQLHETSCKLETEQHLYKELKAQNEQQIKSLHDLMTGDFEKESVAPSHANANN